MSSGGAQGEVPPKKKTSMMYKAKKCMATKVGGAKLGQDVINRFLGENGSLIVETLHKAAVMTVGDKRAKELLSYIYQLALKVKILHDEKLLTLQDRASLVKPINNLSIQLYQTLDQGTTSDFDDAGSEEKVIDVTHLALKVAQLEALVLVVLQRELHDNSVRKAKEAIGFFGGRSFLNQVINDVAYSELKGSLTAGLFRIVHERLQQEDLLPAPVRCRTARCVEEALVRSGKFAGSLYCEDCHAVQMKDLLTSPNIRHFLVGNGMTHRPFAKRIESGLPPHVPMLYKALWNYRAARPGLRRIFSEGVFEKYFGEKATHRVECVDEKTIEELEEALAQPIPNEQKFQREDIFAAVEEELFAVTDPFFQKEILGCKEYKQYLASRKLPKERRITVSSAPRSSS